MRREQIYAAMLVAFGALTAPAQISQFTQGPLLLGTGASTMIGINAPEQGYSVAISGDGSTAMVGAPFDSEGVGATWVWGRASDGTWTQQGSKMIGLDAAPGWLEGYSVAISADGNTVIATGQPGVITSAPTITLWTRSNGIWTQGSSLAGSLPATPTESVTSIAISGDSQTIAFGVASDNTLGAVWVFTLNNGNWVQQGAKMFPTSPLPPITSALDNR